LLSYPAFDLVRSAEMSEMTLVLIGVALGLAVAFMLRWINVVNEPFQHYSKNCPCGKCEIRRVVADDQFLLQLVVLDKDAEIEDYQW